MLGGVVGGDVVDHDYSELAVVLAVKGDHVQV